MTRSVFPGYPQLAILSSVAFCLSPPSMFMSALYTESPFALLSFTGMLWYSQEHYLGASILWGLASSIRSNAIIYSGFFIYDLIVKRIGKVIKDNNIDSNEIKANSNCLTFFFVSVYIDYWIDPFNLIYCYNIFWLCCCPILWIPRVLSWKTMV